jgi:hypothetical protein
VVKARTGFDGASAVAGGVRGKTVA